MPFREHMILLITLCITFIIYYIIFSEYLTVFQIFLLSMWLSFFIKTVYDMKNKGGSRTFYQYSEKTNQILRFLIMLFMGTVSGIMNYLAFVYHSFKF